MEGVAELGEVEGIKTVAGMYCMRGESVFNKKRKKNRLSLFQKQVTVNNFSVWIGEEAYEFLFLLCWNFNSLDFIQTAAVAVSS